MRIQNQQLSVQSPPSIVWISVWALAIVQASFTLSWVIYRIHLPKILTEVGFSPEFAPGLLLLETVLAIAVEPLAGWYSDYTRQHQHSRFPLIWLGIILSSVCFLVIPLLTVWVDPTRGAHWGSVGLLIVWAIAMSLFRSPALALLQQTATPARLPQAASLLTLAAGLAGATLPLASKAILGMGTSVACIGGAILLLGAIAVLWCFGSPAMGMVDVNHRHRLSWRQWAAIAGLGLSVTLVFRLAIETFPKILKAQLPDLQPPGLIGIIFVTMGIAALPAGWLATRFGNRMVMLVGLGGMAAALSLMLATSTTVVAFLAGLLLGISFSLISNGTLPLILSLVASRSAGLAVGLFFGGTAIATSLLGRFGSTLTQPGTIIPWGTGLLALLITGLCLSHIHSNRRLD